MPTDDSDIEDILRRRRKKHAAKNRQALFFALGGLALLVGLAVVVGGVLLLGGSKARVAVAGPSASREGETWTHRELFEFMKAKGVVTEMGYGVPKGPFGPGLS